jgi:hypothetical protein
MLNSDEVETLEQDKQSAATQKEIERSFAKDAKVWNGLTLQPYSASREAAADSMGLKFGYRFTAADREEFFGTGLYAGIKRDIGIVMWLCAKASEDEIHQAGTYGPAAERKANEWARENKLQDMGSDEFASAHEIFIAIMNELYAARTKVEKKSQPTTTPKK